MCPLTTVILPKINLEHLELLRPWGLRASSPGVHDTNLNTLSTQTPRGHELLGHIKKEWQSKMMAVFFFFAHEKGFKFHAHPKLAHINCCFHFSQNRPYKEHSL